MDTITSKEAAAEFFGNNPEGTANCVNAKNEEKECSSIEEATAHFEAGEANEEGNGAGDNAGETASNEGAQSNES